ncbi:acetyltransferase [Stagonosporopsis vannaccii]|nr:acetyltransferase [Stagonosporopsis vannaccii]
MQTTKHTLLNRTWTRDNYLISTDPTLIPVSQLIAAFATNLVYWANPLPEDIMRETLSNSLCFGLYSTSTPESRSEVRKDKEMTLIGFARCITDFATFSYITDVYILPAHQGGGLGKWLVRCVGEVHDEMPFLRRSMLFTSDWERSVPFYEQVLGMRVLDAGKGREGGGPAVMQKLGPGFPMGLR